MMQAGNRLIERRSVRGAVGGIEPGLLLPSQQCPGRDIHRARGVFDRSLRQERDDRILLLPPEFCAVAGHLRTPADIWASSDPATPLSPSASTESRPGACNHFC